VGQWLNQAARLLATLRAPIEPALQVTGWFDSQYVHLAITARTVGPIFSDRLVVPNQLHSLRLAQLLKAVFA